MVANVAAAASRLSVRKVTKGDGDGSSIHEGSDEMCFENLLTGISPSSGFECSQQR